MDSEDGNSFARRFTRADRRRLARALKTTRDARVYRRLQATLAIASGEPLAAVARRALAARSTVLRWVERYLATHAVEALEDRPGRGRRPLAPELSAARLERYLSSDPRACGYEANEWTVPLLAAHLRREGIRLSARTLRRRIRQARFRWKRPRYVYAERAEHVGAKKGGLLAA